MSYNNILFGNGLLATIARRFLCKFCDVFPNHFTGPGEHHRRQRKLPNPIFPSRHLAEIIPVFYEVIRKVRARDVPVKRGEILSISVLGHNFDDLGRESLPNEDAHPIKNLGPKKLNFLRMPLVYVVGSGAPSFRRSIVKMIPLADMMDIIHNTPVAVFESKKAALTKGNQAVVEQIGRGKDAMSVLPNLEASANDRLPEDELIDQMSARKDAVFPLSKPMIGASGIQKFEGRTLTNGSESVGWLSFLPAFRTPTNPQFMLPLSLSSQIDLHMWGPSLHYECRGFRFSQLEMNVVLSLLLLQL
ncbi:hypothetical protein FIBSPDRAFT_813080 [Athelia psychrophila]|uniref:Uncharacterized protein n=1 Tax=Athelia psychrophila TaxID=1759441 RepID=A0A166UUR3_9AGAM|nr:hypothetical protein FIBSPDRAFT_813080 [Fibularhizoctonia sp. CBS 109695]